MIVFLVTQNLGWGKGKSLTEALKNHRLHNGNFRGKYQLVIFDCPTEEDYLKIYSNEFEYTYSKDTKKLYKGIEQK